MSDGQLETKREGHSHTELTPWPVQVPVTGHDGFKNFALKLMLCNVGIRFMFVFIIGALRLGASGSAL
jgi:hypothetical protein